MPRPQKYREGRTAVRLTDRASNVRLFTSRHWPHVAPSSSSSSCRSALKLPDSALNAAARVSKERSRTLR